MCTHFPVSFLLILLLFPMSLLSMGTNYVRERKNKINFVTRHQKLTNSSFLSYVVKIVLPRAISCSQRFFLLLADTRTAAGIQREIYDSDNFHTSYEISVILPSVLQIFFILPRDKRNTFNGDNSSLDIGLAL